MVLSQGEKGERSFLSASARSFKTLLHQVCIRFGGFLKLGVPFGGPHNEEYSILGSMLGSLYFGKLPFVFVASRLRLCGPSR